MLLLCAVAIVGASTGAALAASLGVVTPKNLGSNFGGVSPCSSSDFGLTMETVFYTPSSRYEIRDVIYTGVPSTCQSQSAKLTIADNVVGYSSLGETTGALAAGATSTLTYPDNAGPNVNSINNTNSQVRAVLVVVGP